MIKSGKIIAPWIYLWKTVMVKKLKWKGYDDLFHSWIDEKDIII